MSDESKPPAPVVLHPARPLILDDHEDDFAAAMMRMAAPILETDEANAEYTAAEALKVSGARPAPGPAGDDMPIPMDYEGED
jgi:hypothetical protein